MRIAMSPAQRRGLTPEIDRLEERAAEMRVLVTTHHTLGRDWRVTVFNGDNIGQRVALRGDGNLGAIIAGALDDWSEKYEWTNEELLMVAVQSGLPVSRG